LLDPASRETDELVPVFLNSPPPSALLNIQRV
jgi:hypothetical protein